MNNLVGNHLGKYELIRLLGHGGMAEVYEAFQPGTERLVAIKVLHGYGNQTPESIARFKREARSIAQLRHTNIIQVFDFDVDQDRYYMVMEYVRGGTLNTYLRENGALTAQHALQVAIQLADGLEYAHGRGVIHRDIKPANIIFADMEHRHPVLTDFGIARIMNETAVTAEGRFMGSPAYLSPEVAMGRPADARSDIYGLGLCLYEMVTGRMPFSADGSTGLVAQHMIAPLPAPRQFNPDVHPAVEMILDKALAKNREQRYQSANEFKLVLERIAESLNGNPVVIQPPVMHPNVRPASGTTVQLAGENGAARSTTLPYETNSHYLSQSDSLPFDEPVNHLPEPNALEAETEPQPRRRRPLVAVVLLIALVGLLGYLALSGNQTIAGDATPTVDQAAALEAANTDEPPAPTFTTTATPTHTLTGTAAATSTPTSTLTATLTATATASYTPSVTPTVDIPPVRENPYFRPSPIPSETPTITPTPSPRPPRPTQSSNTNPPAQPVTAPTNPGAGATNAPGSGDGGDAGGGAGSGGGGSTNPVSEVVDTVEDVGNGVGDLLDNLLPPLPTICLLGC